MPVLNKLSEPTLILDVARCKINIRNMAEKAKKAGLRLRPHFKTHQSHVVGRWMREAGIECATVSSLRMAEYFAADGWKDVTVAFPLNILEMERVNRLAKTIRLNILAENLEALQALETHLQTGVQVMIKIDVGYGRTGVPWTKRELIDKMLDFMETAGHLQFAGFLTHAGHTYQARSAEEIYKVHKTSIAGADRFKDAYITAYPNLILSVGDTPSCSAMDDFGMADEIRPGNFVFYDLTQVAIGSCSLEQIAVAMACPVVAKHPERREIVVYGGGVHLSKDRLAKNGQTIFGQIVSWSDKGWTFPEQVSPVVSLSQEHGIIKASPELLEKTQIGDLLGVLPVHSCMAADLMKRYITTEGEWIEMTPKW